MNGKLRVAAIGLALSVMVALILLLVRPSSTRPGYAGCRC